jgi:NADPH-dependent ferric siderophore reductase
VAHHDTIPTHLTEVVTAAPVGDSFVRVTFGGLDRFRRIGPDDFVYVLLPPPGRRDLPIDTSFRWSDYDAMAEPDRPVGAYYTVRHFRPEAGELDCDVFLHDPAGHVSAWAPGARRGDAAALWGPRSAWHPPTATTDWLLVADETGLPALAAVLEHRPAETPVRAFVEVDATAERPCVPCGDGIEVTWLERRGREAGTTDLLVEAVRSASPPSPTTYAWGGAESRAVSAVRRHLRHEVGLAKERVSMTPYWRHASHAQDPVDADD